MTLLPVRWTRIATKQLAVQLPHGKTHKKVDSISSNLQKKVRPVVRTREGKHLIAAGRTGVGKTYLIMDIVQRKLALEPHKNLYIIDTKKRGDFTEKDGPIIKSLQSPDAFHTSGNRMIWQPEEDNKEQYSKFFTRILNAGLPAIVVIDESINMKFGDTIPRGLSILCAQGRLPGIDVLAGTQEIAKSPRQLISQASFVVVFDLLNEYDEKAAIRLLQLPSNVKHLGLAKHHFFIRNLDDGLPGKRFKTVRQLPDTYI